MLEAAVRVFLASELPQGRQLGVEFLPGKLSEMTGKGIGEDLLEDKFSCLRMGSSIGKEGGHISGSLGGFVTLRVGDRDHHGFLTNHHIIRPHSSNSDDKDGSEEAKSEKPYQYLLYSTSRPVIQYPSPEDLQARQAKINKQIVGYSRQLEAVEREQQLRVDVGAEAKPAAENTRQAYLQIIRDSRDDLMKIDSRFPLKLGKALVSSGSAINSDLTILDWAFIQFNGSFQNFLIQQSPLLNEIPSLEEPALQPERYESDSMYVGSRTTEPFAATEFGDIKKGS